MKNEMMEKYLFDINSNISKIEEHLKSINGTVQRHEKQINSHETEIKKISNRQTYYAGGISAIVIIMGLILKFI